MGALAGSDAGRSVIDIMREAEGRWREILAELGVSPQFLKNKHGPCPICGGKDRFRFDDKEGSGSYFCNQCGAGNGLSMLRKLHKWTYQDACEQIAKCLPAARRRVQERPDDDTQAQYARRNKAIDRLWSEGDAQWVVDRYHARRGIAASSPVLRGHGSCPYYDEKTRELLGRYPAVLAPITSPDGRMVTIQRIYDAQVSPRKKS